MEKRDKGIDPKLIVILGGIVGAAIGLLGAWLYLNNAPRLVDEEGDERVVAPDPKSALKVAVSLLGVLRMIAGQGK